MPKSIKDFCSILNLIKQDIIFDKVHSWIFFTQYIKTSPVIKDLRKNGNQMQEKYPNHKINYEAHYYRDPEEGLFWRNNVKQVFNI